MITLYIDGKLASWQAGRINFFSQEVRDKFDERALQALIDLLTSEICENAERIQAVSSKAVLENLKIHWEGLSHTLKKSIEEDGGFFVWPIKDVLDCPNACITFPTEWDGYLHMPGDTTIRLEGQLGLRRGIESLAENENWYFSNNGESLMLDVDVVFCLPWLNKRVRIPNFCKYEITAADDNPKKMLFGYEKSYNIITSARNILAEADDDDQYWDEDFVDGFKVLYHESTPITQMQNILEKELECDCFMSDALAKAFISCFDNVEKEALELLCEPNMTRCAWAYERD